MTPRPQKSHTPMLLGWREKVALPELGLNLIHAKIDTGARTSALHATEVETFFRDDGPWVRFHIPHQGQLHAADCEARLVDIRNVKNTSGVGVERLIVETQIVIGARRWRIEVSLADRERMAMPLIIGRTAIRRHSVLVDPGKSFCAGLPKLKRKHPKRNDPADLSERISL